MEDDHKKPRTRRYFSPEFKARTVELIRTSGKSIGEVSRELDLTETAVRDWVRQADVDDGKRTRVVADGVSADTVAWGPGPDIVYVDRADSNLYAVAPDGSRKRPMSSSPASMHRGPAWSPDGRQVLYWSDNTTRANVPGPSVAGVVTVTADGATTKVIAPRGGSAVWSPDGTAIAFLAEQNGLNVLMTTLADGSNPRVLVGPGSNVASQPPAWDSRLTGGAIE